jgi:hypothetical protein
VSPRATDRAQLAHPYRTIMSTKATSRVWTHSAFRGNSLIVLLCFADLADADGVCWPSLDRIAIQSRLNPRTTKDALAQLVDAGELFFDEDHQRMKGKQPHYLVTCGMSRDEMYQILTSHEKLRYPPEEAGRLADEISSKQAAWQKQRHDLTASRN